MPYSVVTNYQTTLSSPMTASQLTVPVNSIYTNDDTPVLLTTAMMGDGWYLVIEAGEANMEVVKVTAVTATSGTAGYFTVPALGRGLAFSGGTDAQASGNAKPHNPGVKVILSNAKNVYDRLVDRESDEDIDGVKTFNESPLVPTPTALEVNAAASVAYVNAVAVAGAPDATTLTKGIVTLGTQADVNTGDDSGPTTASNVVVPSTHLQTWDLIVTTDYTYGATIAAGDILYLDGADSKWKLADASVEATALNAFGFALDAGVDTDTGKRVQLAGIVTGLAGLTAGQYVYVSDTAGDYSTTPGTYNRVIGKALSTSSLIMTTNFDINGVAGVSSDIDTEIINSQSIAKFGGTGADGALTVSSGTTTLDLGGAKYFQKNYTTITIAAGATLDFTNPNAEGTIVNLKATGAVTIAGTIDLRGVGGQASAGGAGGASQGQSGSNGADGQDSDYILDTTAHYGGAGLLGATNNGGNAVSGPVAYTLTGQGNLYTISDDVLFRRLLYVVPGAAGGSGGGGAAGNTDPHPDGGAGGAGGDGGGALILEVRRALDFTGTINADGQDGSVGTAGTGNVPTDTAGGGGGGGGGGGAGGHVIVLYNELTAASGTITVNGGDGGAGGNGGARNGSPAGGTGGGGGSAGAGGASFQGAGGASQAASDGNGSTGSVGGAAGAGGAEGASGSAGSSPTSSTNTGDGGAGSGGGGGGGGEALILQNRWFY